MHSKFPRPIEVLRDTFGYAAFRDAQGEIVDHVVAGGDALVLMPTGSARRRDHDATISHMPRHLIW